MSESVDERHEPQTNAPTFRSTDPLSNSTWGDIRSVRALWAKGLLFLMLGILASLFLLLQQVSATVLLLHAIAIWAFCRAYYFAFYVIEHYADPSFRFAGLIDFVRYACSRR